ncbi:condensation domain-containing protein [Chryseobacterium sp. PTM-20240506]|uniref:condensation domain-containing protein n=1 Tax=unclassified Chryseobacterium TaxID=2593645 RepID=UPI0015558C08|nr:MULTISPECIES: condensation domain-containing protein [unclassified Chryseobacterium]MDC8104631.1 condensation domain-containing protein [Chryseobacterium sp. B21-037]MDQ1806171.1 condensation domain-containing protein [Chryseobacterium sp. CKR4-1]
MKRKLLFGERMILGDGTEAFNGIIPFRLRGTFKLEEIQRALALLQNKHPWLKAHVTHDEENLPWFEVPQKVVPIPIRIVIRQGEDDWQKESMKEWYMPFDHEKFPLIRFVWIKGEEVSDMFFSFHHCLCDGGSAMTLLYEFLQVLDNPSADIGVENPILGIQDIVPANILNSRRHKLKAKVLGRVASTIIKYAPVNKKPIERQNDYMIHWKFDKEMTQQVISYCKSNGFTVNTFLCAIVLQAFKKIRGKAALNKICCPVDIRRLTTQIKHDHIFAFGLMVEVSINEKLNFLDNVRKMQKHVKRKTSKLDPYTKMMIIESWHYALDNFTRILRNGKATNDCMLSNLGLIQVPHEYRNFTVDTVFSPSALGPLGQTTGFVVSTFQGEMDFCFIGSEGYLPYSDAQAIRKDILDTIKLKLEYSAVS